MADVPGIEASVTQSLERAAAQSRERAVRWLLAELEPHTLGVAQAPLAQALPYVEVIRRLQNALATEFHRVRGEGEPDAVLRPSDGGSREPDDPMPGP